MDNRPKALKDDFRHKGMRTRMIEELREKGVTDERVLQAMFKVPRHWFLDDAFLEIAYENRAFPIGCEQTISHPYTVAFQSELLGVEKGEKVLEIGTGCGYQTSILCELGAKVFSVERQKDLYEKAKITLRHMKYRATTFYGDGYKGLPTYGPFDKIIVTAGAPYIPDALLEQLNVGGMLVIPVGGGDSQIMNAIVKTGENSFEREELGDFSFVPMLQKKAR